MPTPEQLIVDALHPRHVETGNLLTRQVAKLAADVNDPEVMAMVADDLEHPAGVNTGEVVRLAHVSYRQLDYWTRKGWLVAHAREGETSGYVRFYPPGEVVKAKIMSALVRLFEMAPSRAAEVAVEILDHGSAQVGGFTLTRKGLTS